jgi:tRNA (guanine-N7-)-methyltransferase
MSTVHLARLFSITTRHRPIHDQPEVLLPREPRSPLLPEQLFRAPEHRHVLELGSGWGEFAAGWLATHPDDDYVAFEIKGDRIRRTLKYVRKLDGGHIRIIPVNFTWFLEEILPPHSFDWIIVNYPDPWPKRRHWKHRLVQPGFPQRMSELLRPRGIVHLASDYGPYARRMIRYFRGSPLFESVFPPPDYVRRRPDDMPLTRFGQITGDREGRTPYFTRWRLREK